jgi:hypothetical protein
VPLDQLKGAQRTEQRGRKSRKKKAERKRDVVISDDGSAV